MCNECANAVYMLYLTAEKKVAKTFPITHYTTKILYNHLKHDSPQSGTPLQPSNISGYNSGSTMCMRMHLNTQHC